MARNQQGKPKMQADKGMDLTRSMPVQFGPIKAQVFGGPFYEWVPGQRRIVSVKMAAEVDHPHDISIPTRDFSVPPQKDMEHGIAKALKAILDGNDLYVGCMGGIGRTGLFMACLAKVMRDYAPGTNALDLTATDADKFRTTNPPVLYVRKHYLSHAVETQKQQDFVDDFSTTAAVLYLRSRLNPEPKVVERKVDHYIEVPVYYWNPWLALMQFLGTGSTRYRDFPTLGEQLRTARNVTQKGNVVGGDLAGGDIIRTDKRHNV